ncbi:MAG: TaqI-like C-terminal specificity domain-containing protein [Candidatus Aquicultor sp.]|nr:TaqI-like C-terminal specificity domain-containing protein [Candidatus Aquicultor sp.]
MAVPDIIFELVERFSRNLDEYKSNGYNETQLRREFLDPFFEALGWDVNNKLGYAMAYREVVHEDAIKIGGFTKAPDYSFRIGGARKFFIEAKRPAVSIKDDISPAFQLRRYAWSAKLPLSILTDFEEFAVYDTRVKPVKTDKASTARILFIKFTEFEERWDEIAGVFSRDAILKGSFDKYAASTKVKRGTAEVDDVFLKEIEAWRDSLARNIALRNPSLSQRELNFAVQTTIDRIIFLRICEDRGIEEYGRLMLLQNGVNVYARLRELFRLADERYNSGLFHFQTEKDRPEAPDSLTPSLAIDDKPLKEIFKKLYYPDSPYEFSVLSADILGQVYEQFLGKVIRLTAGHKAVVEDKPEVKKAGGVYYTPTYIVDYIVKQTVGKLLEGKTPRQASKLRILDPACGSGSFLIGAYQYLLDWHLKTYSDVPDKHKKVLYMGPGGDWRLTTAEKKRILLNNIYGADIDTQAVEVTKLSLLLKVLEGESDETLNAQLRLFHERALPDLGHNIKCGNSLIGPDFYEQQLSLLDEEEAYRINAFDWDKEFAEIMQAGGFDAVIGNPPYVRQEVIGELKEYFKNHYEAYHGIADLYVYFIEKGVTLLKINGLFSYIVANKWMRANYGEPLRRWMKKQRIEEIIDFGDLPVFESATTYPCIVRICKGTAASQFSATQVETLNFSGLSEYVSENSFAIEQAALDSKGWSLVDKQSQDFLNKLRKAGIPLVGYVNGRIYRGLLTGLSEAFVIDEETKNRLIEEHPQSQELIKPFLLGRDIKRYKLPESVRQLILIPKGWTREQIHRSRESVNPEESTGFRVKQEMTESGAWKWFSENYPAIAAHLEAFAEKGKKRYDKGEYWWELRTCDYYEEFEKPKIMLPDISVRGNFILEEKGIYFSANTTYIICSGDKYLLGILNSPLMTFFYKHNFAAYRGGYLRFFTQYLEKLPIRTINFSDPTDKANHDKMVSLVERMLDLNKQLATAKTPHDTKVIQTQIDATDRQIDNLVYEFYDLTEEEIKIVEEATR